MNSPLRRYQRAARYGFSLLELILVLAIIVTLSAIAAPRYANATSRYRAEVAGRRIAADLDQARGLAKATSASITVTFDVVNDQYTLAGVRSLKKAATDSIVVLSEEPYRVTLEVALFGGDGVVVFDGYGIPDSGGNVVVSCGGYQATVNLSAQTGKSAAVLSAP